MLAAVVLIIWILIYLIRRNVVGKKCHCSKNLTGKTVLITGSNSGIGLALAELLVQRGATIILACRTLEKALSTSKHIKKKYRNAKIIVIDKLDLTDFNSIINFTTRLKELDLNIYGLVNNAGIFYAPPKNTVNNFEETFQTNYLGLYLLTNLLLPVLRNSKESRIINVSSSAHMQILDFPKREFHWAFRDTPQNRFKSYAYSKFCVALFSYKLKSIITDKGLSVHCVDPGNTETNIFRHFPQLSNKFLYYLQKPIRLIVIKTPLQGAQGILHALLASNPPFYTKNLEEAKNINTNIYNKEFSSQLWRISQEYCAKYMNQTKYPLQYENPNYKVCEKR